MLTLLIASVEHGNGLFAFFDNNLINWLVLVGLIAYMMSRLVPGLLASRRQSIESALKEASQARLEGLAFMEAQQKRVANAEKEAEEILVEARKVADQMRQQIEEQTAREIADLEAKIEQQVANERQLAVTQLRQAAAGAAIKLAELTLPHQVTAQTKERLLGEFLDQLEGTGSKA